MRRVERAVVRGDGMDSWDPDKARALVGTFNLSERLLLWLSKDPATVFRGAYEEGVSGQWDDANALSTLRREYPDFDALIAGQRVLDYGCGDGFQAIAMAKAGASHVVGVDLQESRLDNARRMAGSVPNVAFSQSISEAFDVAISLNAFEHFPEPASNLRELGDAVRIGGRILITFGPPWFAPYGAHMHFFTSCPWVNILFSERTVHRVRMLYRADGHMNMEYGPPKMTVAMFDGLIARSGLEVEHVEYRTVRNLPVSGIPILRELFVNHITCVLRKTA